MGKKLTLKDNYNSISKAIQKRVRNTAFTNSEVVKKKFTEGMYLCWEGERGLGSHQSENVEKIITDKHMKFWKSKA